MKIEHFRNIKNKNSGVTLVEILLVCILISITAALGIISFAGMRERALDREAITNLNRIVEAERYYHMENQTYYPASGIESNITLINENLTIRLPNATKPNWIYTVNSNGCAQAVRNDGGSRSWSLAVNETGEPREGTICP